MCGTRPRQKESEVPNMSRYILIQTKDPLTYPDTGIWINSDHIISIESSDLYTTIRLANGDNIEARYQDDIDILSMLNLDTETSCGTMIADSPGVPARTEMSRTLSKNGWTEWTETVIK